MTADIKILDEKIIKQGRLRLKLLIQFAIVNKKLIEKRREKAAREVSQ